MRILSEAAKVAVLCRKHLKEQKIKASVKSENYAGGNSVGVVVKDQKPEVLKVISKEFSKYEYGHFDGMTDTYEFSNTRDDIPQTRFLFVKNEFSDELKQKAWTALLEDYNYDKVEYPEILKDVPSHLEFNGELACVQVHRLLSGVIDEASKSFWNEV